MLRARSCLVLLLLVAGCRRGPRTAEEAFADTERALAADDAVALFRCLDQQTRWEVESAYKDQQLMRTIIRAKYPEEEAERALAPLAAAAESDAARYFARVATERRMLERFRARLGTASAPLARRPGDGDDHVYLWRQDGQPLHFARNRDTTWGWSELGTEWALEKDRANHAVSTVRENAALYQKAEK
jgi:hypothetical protein